MGTDVFEISVNFIKMVVIFLMMVQIVPILVWVERRGSAYIQNRFGPNRVGPLGLMQLLADAVKFLTKARIYSRARLSGAVLYCPGCGHDSRGFGIWRDSLKYARAGRRL